ncbi:hypothetical protein ABFW07_10215 [Acinetobacter soli]|uniref:hypothetical protein n=1 Tax=Acinetobacter soli TaxID=487316 RepID=UPI003218896F
MLTNPTLTNPLVQQLIQRLNPNSYQDFLDLLYKDLDEIINDLQQDREALLKKFKACNDDAKIFEDDVNNQIVRSLKYKCYNSAHDKFHNGHVDIHVTIPGFEYTWLGESKIWNGVTYIDQGFKQLNDAYSTGEDNDSAGGVLIYIVDTQLTANAMMEKWANSLLTYDPSSPPNNVKGLGVYCEYPSNRKNSFISTHEHPYSGLEYNVRHMSIYLRHDPTVKTAVKKKKVKKVKVTAKTINPDKKKE